MTCHKKLIDVTGLERLSFHKRKGMPKTDQVSKNAVT